MQEQRIIHWRRRSLCGFSFPSKRKEARVGTDVISTLLTVFLRATRREGQQTFVDAAEWKRRGGNRARRGFAPGGIDPRSFANKKAKEKWNKSGCLKRRSSPDEYRLFLSRREGEHDSPGAPGRRYSWTIEKSGVARCTNRTRRGKKEVKQRGGGTKKEGRKERCTVNAFRDVSPKATEPLILIIGYSLLLLVPGAYLSTEPTCIATYSRTCPLPFFFPFSSTHLGKTLYLHACREYSPRENFSRRSQPLRTDVHHLSSLP